jgi:hypothetical protein
LFLEKYPISEATIKGIGDGRKAVLRSYGIETAADIERSRIESISGFGAATVGVLLGWRVSVERNFMFDPTQPIDPADIRAIKNDIARQSADLAMQLRQSLLDLRQSAASIVGVRTSLRTSAVAVWNRQKQCELDAASAGNPLTINTRRGIFGAISVAGFLVVHAVNFHASELRPVRPIALPNPDSPAPASPVPPPTALPNPEPPALPPPDVSVYQFRLSLHGFGSPELITGTWNQETREALRDFKAANGLPIDDVRDERTWQQLISPAAIRAHQSIIGEWRSAEACDAKSSGPPSLVVNSRQATSPAGLTCEFRQIDRSVLGWHVHASCTVNGNNAWDSDITWIAGSRELNLISKGKSLSYYRQCPVTSARPGSASPR